MRWLAVMLCSGLMGCKPVPVIYDCPVITLPPEPMFPTKLLKDGAKPDQVVKYYYADDVAARAALKAIHDQIDSVNKAYGGAVQAGK